MNTLFSNYTCGDYLALAYQAGVFDEDAQQWLILPPSKAYEHDDFLVIGSPGVDGIEWGYRKSETGIWMYEPISQEFLCLAPSLAEFLQGWEAGAITV